MRARFWISAHRLIAIAYELKKRRSSILFLAAMVLAISIVNAQKPYFLIQSVKTKEITKVKKGQFLQCIQRNTFGQEEFVFGEVTAIRHDGVMLRTNPYIPGSGGFVFYEDIVHIDKIKLMKRGILPASVAGIVLGQLAFAFHITMWAMGPLEAAAVYYTMFLAVKQKRKSLFKNRVPQEVILITPGVGFPGDHYFESSSLNQPE